MTQMHPILNSNLSNGYCNCNASRNLTSREAAALRARGVACSTAWLVSPRSDSVGELFRPASRSSGAGYTNTGIVACLR